MKFDEYQIEAFKTALPSAKRLDYAVIGLGAEAGEVLNKFKKHIRDGKFDKVAFLDELGDCLWYAALICSLEQVSLADVAKRNLEKLSDRKTRGVIAGSGDNR